MNTKNPKQFPPFSMLESAAILLALILALNLAQPACRGRPFVSAARRPRDPKPRRIRDALLPKPRGGICCPMTDLLTTGQGSC